MSRLSPSLRECYAVIVVCGTAITKRLQLGGISHRNSFSHESGGNKFKITVLVDVVSDERALFLACRSLPSCYVLMHADRERKKARGRGRGKKGRETEGGRKRGREMKGEIEGRGRKKSEGA